MTLNELREVASIKAITIYNKEQKEEYTHPDYSVYGLLCKYGDCKVLSVRAVLSQSGISSIDGSICIKPEIYVIIEDKE